MSDKSLPTPPMLPPLRGGADAPLAPPPLASRRLLPENRAPTPLEEKAKASVRNLSSMIDDLYKENEKLHRERRRTYIEIATLKRQNQLCDQAFAQQTQRVAQFVHTVNRALQ